MQEQASTFPKQIFIGVGNALKKVPESQDRFLHKTIDKYIYPKLNEDQKAWYDAMRPKFQESHVLGYTATAVETLILAAVVKKGIDWAKRGKEVSIPSRPVSPAWEVEGIQFQPESPAAGVVNNAAEVDPALYEVLYKPGYTLERIQKEQGTAYYLSGAEKIEKMSDEWFQFFLNREDLEYVGHEKNFRPQRLPERMLQLLGLYADTQLAEGKRRVIFERLLSDGREIYRLYREETPLEQIEFAVVGTRGYPVVRSESWLRFVEKLGGEHTPQWLPDFVRRAQSYTTPQEVCRAFLKETGVSLWNMYLLQGSSLEALNAKGVLNFLMQMENESI